MRSSGRRGRFSARSASTTSCKPGVELSNTLDEDCTVIRRVPRQRLPVHSARYARATYAGLRPAPRAMRARREPSAQSGYACRRPGQFRCGCTPRRWSRTGTPSTAATPRRVACEDRAGLLLDLTEHLKAQQVRRLRRGAAGRRRTFRAACRQTGSLRRCSPHAPNLLTVGALRRAADDHGSVCEDGGHARECVPSCSATIGCRGHSPCWG